MEVGETRLLSQAMAMRREGIGGRERGMAGDRGCGKLDAAIRRLTCMAVLAGLTCFFFALFCSFVAFFFAFFFVVSG